MPRVLLASLLVPALALLAGLGFVQRAPRADFVLTSGEPRTLDPHRVSWLPEIQLAATLFEGLTRLNDETFAPEPAVAERWDVGPDGRVYVFHLRPTARWSTGEPVTAEDFRFAWLRVLDPRSEAPYANLLFAVRGARDYYNSRRNADDADDVPAGAVAVLADGERTLRVELSGPCPYFLELTSFITLAPVHRPTLERWAYRDGRVLRSTQHLWTRPAHLVGNGPFRLTRWEFKRSIGLERNPHYWDAATLDVHTIEAWITTDPGAALIAYETGRADLVRWLEAPVAEVLQAEQAAGRRQDFYTGDRFATFFYRVNCRRPPLDNPELRKALSLAIDRAALCKHVLRLGEPPAWTLVPRPALARMTRSGPGDTVVRYEPPSGLGAALSPAQRAELAREYLRRSGFGTRSEPRPIEITFPPDPEQRALAEAVQAMWESTLGLRVELRPQEPKVLSSRIRDLDYDVARSDWFGDYLDPDAFLGLFVSVSGHNRTGWTHAEYDRLVGEAAGEADDARRYALLAAAERILCEEELPIIPVFHRRGNYLLNPRFTGLRDNVRDLLQIHRVRRRE
ncbi:MAG: peptide ABC transporter substrate-binding protein [Planctomycetota bacterium]